MDFVTDAQAVLQRVVAKLGDAAASQLGLTQAALVRLLNGAEPLPTSVLLRAVDIVLDEVRHVPSGEPGPLNRTEA
jgi:hypothetical protein